jgi:hypothetical protein
MGTRSAFSLIATTRSISLRYQSTWGVCRNRGPIRFLQNDKARSIAVGSGSFIPRFGIQYEPLNAPITTSAVACEARVLRRIESLVERRRHGNK